VLNLQIESDSVVHCVITGNTYNFRSRLDWWRNVCDREYEPQHEAFEIVGIVIRMHSAFKGAGTIQMQQTANIFVWSKTSM